jgi:hypothetical protein
VQAGAGRQVHAQRLEAGIDLLRGPGSTCDTSLLEDDHNVREGRRAAAVQQRGNGAGRGVEAR